MHDAAAAATSNLAAADAAVALRVSLTLHVDIYFTKKNTKLQCYKALNLPNSLPEVSCQGTPLQSQIRCGLAARPFSCRRTK